MPSGRPSSSVLAFVSLLAVSGPANLTTGQAAQAPPATPGPTSITERLARMREQVFTRPDRADASVRELHQLLALDPSLAEAHLLLGLTHAGRGTEEMNAEAVAEFRQALELEPALTPARFYLARTYLELGQVERAREELLTTVAQQPGRPQFMAVLAETERRLARPARAAEVAREALALDANFAQARYYLALALIDLDRRPEAIVELERVVKAGVNLADVYLTLGAAYLDVGRTDDAITTLNRGFQLAPPKPDARIYLARAYRLKGDPVRAEAQLDAALPPGTTMQASAYYQQIEADLHFERGMIRAASNQTAAARRAFEQAVAMKPDHGPAHQQLAGVYQRLGLTSRAADEMALADSLGAPVSDAVRAAITAAVARSPKGTTR